MFLPQLQLSCLGQAGLLFIFFRQFHLSVTMTCFCVNWESLWFRPATLQFLHKSQCRCVQIMIGSLIGTSAYYRLIIYKIRIIKFRKYLNKESKKYFTFSAISRFSASGLFSGSGFGSPPLSPPPGMGGLSLINQVNTQKTNNVNQIKILF